MGRSIEGEGLRPDAGNPRFFDNSDSTRPRDNWQSTLSEEHISTPVVGVSSSELPIDRVKSEVGFSTDPEKIEPQASGVPSAGVMDFMAQGVGELPNNGSDSTQQAAAVTPEIKAVQDAAEAKFQEDAARFREEHPEFAQAIRDAHAEPESPQPPVEAVQSPVEAPAPKEYTPEEAAASDARIDAAVQKADAQAFAVDKMSAIKSDVEAAAKGRQELGLGEVPNIGAIEVPEAPDLSWKDQEVAQPHIKTTVSAPSAAQGTAFPIDHYEGREPDEFIYDTTAAKSDAELPTVAENKNLEELRELDKQRNEIRDQEVQSPTTELPKGFGADWDKAREAEREAIRGDEPDEHAQELRPGFGADWDKAREAEREKIRGDEDENETPTGPERLRVLDASEVARRMALTRAEEKLNAILSMRAIEGEEMPLGAVGRFFRSISARMGEKAYRAKLFEEEWKAIESNQDLMAEINARLYRASEVRTGPVDEKTYELLDTIMEQAEAELLENEELGQNVVRGGAIFGDLLVRLSRGEFANREEFEKAQKEAIDAAIEQGIITQEQFAGDEERQSEARGLMYATNLWEISQARIDKVKEKYTESGEWDQVDEKTRERFLREALAGIEDLDLQLGLKLADLNDRRPEYPDERGDYLGLVDRMIDSSMERPVLRWIINPTSAGLVTYVGSSGLLRLGAVTGATAAVGLATGGLALAATPLVAGAAVGGILAGMRRFRNLAYDRGTEQRREALGLEGDTRAAETIRGFGFGEIGASASELAEAIRSGDTEAALRAEALLAVEREFRRDGAGVDLIFADAEEGQEYQSNLRGRVDLLKALKEYRATNELSDDEISERAAEIIGEIGDQDADFESYRMRSAVWTGVGTTVAGIALGALAQQGWHVALERLGFHPNNTTVIEAIMSRRGWNQGAHEAFFAGVNGQEYHPGDSVPTTVKLPKLGQGVEVTRTLVGDKPGSAHWEYALDHATNGVKINKLTGVIEYSYGANKTTAVTPETWGSQGREMFAQATGLKTAHASWGLSADNGTAPIGSSYAAGNMRANANELAMDFVRGKDGKVTISVARAMGTRAFGDGHHFDFTPETMKDFVFTIGPRNNAVGPNGVGMDHLVTIARPDSHGNFTLSAEAAKQIFDASGHLKPGWQVTGSQVMSNYHGKLNLYQVVSDFKDGVAHIIETPRPDHVNVPDLPFKYVPEVLPVTSTPPLNPEFRRPIGVAQGKTEKQLEEEVVKSTDSEGKNSAPAPVEVPPLSENKSNQEKEKGYDREHLVRTFLELVKQHKTELNPDSEETFLRVLKDIRLATPEDIVEMRSFVNDYYNQLNFEMAEAKTDEQRQAISDEIDSVHEYNAALIHWGSEIKSQENPPTSERREAVNKEAESELTEESEGGKERVEIDLSGLDSLSEYQVHRLQHILTELAETEGGSRAKLEFYKTLSQYRIPALSFIKTKKGRESVGDLDPAYFKKYLSLLLSRISEKMMVDKVKEAE